MDPKLVAWAKKAEDKDSKWPLDKLAKAKKIAEKLKKSNPAFDNPHALSRWMTARAKKEG